jgi:hypothetical protein
MAIWSPLLLNSPVELLKYFSGLGIYIEQSDNDLFHDNYCIVLSTWHQEKTFQWLNTLKTLRRTGSYNPVILISFLPEEAIMNQVLFSREGLYFLRLPFSSKDFISLLASINNPCVKILDRTRQQLCFENICALWVNLHHGKSDEMINTIFVPLRMALLLDVENKEKLNVIQQIVDGPNSKYWHSPIILSIRNDVKNLKYNSGLGTIIHQFFNDLSELFANINALQTDHNMVEKIDHLISTFNEIDKSLSR